MKNNLLSSLKTSIGSFSFIVRPTWVQSIGCKSRAMKAGVVVSLTQG